MLPEKVSIIIVCLNAEKTIRKAIRSVLEQQYKNIELIIIDGKSTDGTVDIITAFNTQIAVFTCEKDKGIYDAMNKGIGFATGEWLLFLGADDWLSPGILGEVFNGEDNAVYDMIYGKVQIENSNRYFGTETNFDQLIENNIPHQAIFYRKTLVTKYGGYDTKYKILADYDLNLKIFETPVYQKKFVDKVIAVFSSVGISNRTIDHLFFSEKLLYFTRQKGLSPKDHRLAKYYFFTGVALVLKKRRAHGFRNIIHPVLFSQKRFYYFLLLLQFLLSQTGMAKKYKTV